MSDTLSNIDVSLDLAVLCDDAYNLDLKEVGLPMKIARVCLTQ
jgi:hypothetical protein